MAEPSPGRPPSSQASNEHGIEEADALLTGHNTGNDASTSSSVGRSKWREVGLFVWALVATAAVVVLAVIYQHSQAESRAGKKSLGYTTHPKGVASRAFLRSLPRTVTFADMIPQWV